MTNIIWERMCIVRSFWWLLYQCYLMSDTGFTDILRVSEVTSNKQMKTYFISYCF